ncbi:sensor histidine kinase [Flexivirga sp.]|uniref:sensor histidine kinase n=1 Tax=Flexivirga sp. TaxID=1962927 RepID=UPI002D7FA592|nr:histidine kinase [Flexivirga sp.]
MVDHPNPAAPLSNRLFRTVVRSALFIRLAALVLAVAASVAGDAGGGFWLWALALAALTFFGLFGRVDGIGWLRRHPSLAMLDVGVVVTMISVSGPDNVLLLATFPAALLIGALFPWFVGVLLLLILELGYLNAVQANGGLDHSPYIATVGVPFVYLAMAGIGFAISYGTRQLADMVVELQRVQGERVAADERARLARDMHDSLGKTMHGIALSAASLPHWIEQDSRRANTLAADLATHAERGAQEARAILVGLRTHQCDRPLLEVLTERCREWSESTGIPVRTRSAGIADIGEREREVVLAVLAEALENVHRHARAQAVEVDFRGDSKHVALSIHDDGVGFADSFAAAVRRQRFGLLGMRERAAAADGTLSIARRAPRGTSVELSLPR